MDSSSVHVLIVEDDPDAALLIERLLSFSLGPLQVTGAGSIEEAITAVRTSGPTIDVIILDLGLPDLPGSDPLDALDAVLAVPDAPPVVVVTGHPDSLGPAALARGAEDFVTKDTLNDRHVIARAVSFAILRRRRAIDLAAQRAQLLRANAQLRHFAGSMAHDLKSPIATAIMMMETAQLPAMHERAETRDRMLSRCERILRRAASQIDFVLEDIASAQRGERVEVDVVEAVAATVEALDAPERLEIEVVADEPLLARQGAIQQILTNLVQNALDHNPEGVVRVRVSTFIEAGVVHLVVEDDGVGIPVGGRAEVFRIGFKGPASEGTGLGLTTVELMAQSLGGAVSLAESEDLGGLAVVVMLGSAAPLPSLDG